jgi:hypothetical protein
MTKHICKHCELKCKQGTKENCAKFTSFNYEDAKKEIRRLRVSKENNNRLEELEIRIRNIEGL